MLVAPFALTEPVARSRKPSAHRAAAPQQPPVVRLWLMAWAVIGTLCVFVFPELRGGKLGGMTLPFWLAIAPWINIAWLTRHRWQGFARHLLQSRQTARSRSIAQARR